LAIGFSLFLQLRVVQHKWTATQLPCSAIQQA
jgi:hypothetical protein